MAQPIQNITINAPAFFGINTQDSPVGLDPSYASIADNCVIDKSGRIGARKGNELVTTNGNAVLGSSRGIEHIFQYTDRSGDLRTLSAGNTAIYSGIETLVDITPAAYTPTANNWKSTSFNNHTYLVQRDHAPLVGTDETGSFVLEAVSAHTEALGTMPSANEVLAAYGRLWVADITGNKYTVYWSDLLLGTGWTGGSSGSIDLTSVWPTGFDEVTALAAHNGFLIIFGKRSILVYQGAEDPATMSLADTVAGVGCVARDSVQATGTDLIFLSEQGVRSFARTIQEKSMPMRDISKNVRSDIVTLINQQNDPIKSAYSAKDAFYLLTFPNSSTVYCFDMRSPLQDGSHRVTTWTAMNPLCFFTAADTTLYIGKVDGIATYSSFTDEGVSYQMRYFSNPLDFALQNPQLSSRTKMLKKFNLTIIGGQNTDATLSWGYDYVTSYTKQSFTFADAQIAEFGVSEYGIGEYTAAVVVNKPSVNGTGSGAVVTIGVEVQIAGASCAIQKIDIHALIGRTI